MIKNNLTYLLLIVALQACHPTILLTDREKMFVKGNVNEIIEWSYIPWRIDDTSISRKQDFQNLDAINYWIFNDSGYIMETGYMPAHEDSLFRIRHYSYKKPYFLEYTINEFGYDTVYYSVFQNIINDTVIQKTFFPNQKQRLYNKSVFDKFGREIYSEIGINSKAYSSNIEYYRNGLIYKKYYRSVSLPRDGNRKYLYNRQGQIREVVDQDNEGQSITTYQYSYDKYGNWITRVTYYNGDPFSYDIRLLKYSINNNH